MPIMKADTLLKASENGGKWSPLTFSLLDNEWWLDIISPVLAECLTASTRMASLFDIPLKGAEVWNEILPSIPFLNLASAEYTSYQAWWHLPILATDDRAKNHSVSL